MSTGTWTILFWCLGLHIGSILLLAFAENFGAMPDYYGMPVGLLIGAAALASIILWLNVLVWAVRGKKAVVA